MTTDSSEGKEFLGRGIAFPLGVDPGRHLAMNRLEEHVRQSILLILQTARGERMMHPDFGAGLDALVFEPASPATMALAQNQVRDTLTRFEPRIDVLRVAATVDPALSDVLLINIDYRVRRTDTVFNLVYPFYLERGAF
jgi:phage baseplate assembly protein W